MACVLTSLVHVGELIHERILRARAVASLKTSRQQKTVSAEKHAL
jgi:hypothetical protein